MTDCEKIFVNKIFNKGMVSRLFKGLLKLNNKLKILNEENLKTIHLKRLRNDK